MSLKGKLLAGMIGAPMVKNLDRLIRRAFVALALFIVAAVLGIVTLVIVSTYVIVQLVNG